MNIAQTAANDGQTIAASHDHVFLGHGHERNERRLRFVIVLCGAMMLIEIVGGLLFGSIALIADALHMSTHAGALLLAALAYTYSRRHAHNPRFTFGTGKFGDLAGFTSAIVLAMIAILIGYEAVSRLLAPVPIHFGEAIPIAVLGLLINIASAWLLSRGDHGHSYGHGHDDHHESAHEAEAHVIEATGGKLLLSIFEDGVPPRFRIVSADGTLPSPNKISLATARPGGVRQNFPMVARDGYLQSREEVPEPHEFTVEVRLLDQTHTFKFEEHAHGEHGQDNNMRAAVIHVIADAAVSVFVIVGLVLARLFGWLWMDPVAGLVGAVVIASWSYGLVRDTGAILLDVNPDRGLADRMRRDIEGEGDQVLDLHLWRLGPGHLGAIVSIATKTDHNATFYRQRLARLSSISHLTIEMA